MIIVIKKWWKKAWIDEIICKMHISKRRKQENYTNDSELVLVKHIQIVLQGKLCNFL